MTAGIDQSTLARLCGTGTSATTGGFDVIVRTANGDVAASHPPGLFHEEDAVRRYHMGCVQGMLYGLVAYSLAEEGVIDPDGMVGNYLSELGLQPGSPGAHMRVRDLLSHSAGYFLPTGNQAQAIWRDWSSFTAFLHASPPQFPAGRVVSYGGAEDGVLTGLIRRVTGRTPHEEVRLRILEPAGVPVTAGYTSYDYHPLTMTLGDLLAVVEHLRTSTGPWATGRLTQALPRDSVAVYRSARSVSPFFPSAFSWGFAGFADGLWGQNGRTHDYCVTIRFDLESEFILALSTAGTEFRRNRLARRITDAHGLRAEEAENAAFIGAIHEVKRDTIAGLYAGSDGLAAEVAMHEGELRCTITKNGVPLNVQQGSIDADGGILGSKKWWMLGMEFFPHPATSSPCLMFGPHAFVRTNPPGA